MEQKKVTIIMIGYFYAGTKLVLVYWKGTKWGILDETEQNTFHHILFHQILSNPMNGTKYHSIQFFFTQFHPSPSIYTYPPTTELKEENWNECLTLHLVHIWLSVEKDGKLDKVTFSQEHKFG